MENKASLKTILRGYGHPVRFSEIPGDVRLKIHQICADFIGGKWDEVRADQLKIKHLRSGTSNMLFLCSLPASHHHTHGLSLEAAVTMEPNEVLLRVYFNPNTENHVLEESVVFTLLSERQLGPKLYGVFQDGRVEEYVHSRALKTHEIRLPAVSVKLARILAQIHRLIVPVDKKPIYLKEAMRKWFSQLQSIFSSRVGYEYRVLINDDIAGDKTLTLAELAEEIELVIRCIEKSKSPIVFCHNDFQEGNLLLKNTDANLETASLGVIDYEYSSYNYRGFDIANHFCEWTFDYSKEDSPYFYWNVEHYPTQVEQKRFAESYLTQYSQTVFSSSLLAADANDFLNEIKPFVPVSHFFWAVWSLVLAETSPVEFDFMEYARCRFSMYYQLRADLLTLLE